MYDLFSNAILLGIIVTIGLLILQRRMDAKTMDYSVTAVPNGWVFSYSLGVYAGKVRVTRRFGCVAPWFVRHIDGWEVIAPMHYSDDEINNFLLTHNPPLNGNYSHAKDVEIYREVMIRNNPSLVCVAGQICSLS